MPFQDIEETTLIDVPRPPSVVERWLRKVFIEDWGLKLLALTITLVLWLAVTDFNKPRTIRTAVQLNFIRPDNLNISNEPPKTVDVLLTGSRAKLNSLNQLDRVATLDISDQRAGERILRLSTDRVHMELPAGVKIESFQPTTIPIRLEPRVESRLPIEVKLEGKPAEGYEVYETNPSPNTVSVRGPASLVDALKKAPTETVSIEGKKESFTVLGVAIDIPDQKIDVLDALVDVAVEIGEKRIEKTFSGLPVRSDTGASVRPPSVTVTVAGPASLLEQLRPEDVKVIVDVTNGRAGAPRLAFPSSTRDRVKLVSIKPSEFSIIR